MKAPPVVLIFSAFDGTGGAGLLADCRAAAAAGGLPLAVAAALTAQNLDGVSARWNVPPARVLAQFAALRAKPLAVKIGVIGNPAAVVACLESLDGNIPAVWDPVLTPTGGAPFADAAQIRLLKKHILPRAFIVTPNRAELSALSGSGEVAEGARRLREAGARFVLATDVGGGAEVRHELYAAGANPVWRARCRRRRGAFHGSGCFFSSVLAARLAAGDSPPKAAARAHRMTLAAIDRALSIPALGRQRLLRV